MFRNRLAYPRRVDVGRYPATADYSPTRNPSDISNPFTDKPNRPIAYINNRPIPKGREHWGVQRHVFAVMLWRILADTSRGIITVRVGVWFSFCAKVSPLY